MLALFTCCCARASGRTDSEDPDEHTRLLDSDVIPVAAHDQAQVSSSEEEVAHQEALRRIVDVASERLLNIAAPSPMAQFSPSMWLAAYYPEKQQPRSSSERSTHLPYSSRPPALQGHSSPSYQSRPNKYSSFGGGGYHRQLRSESSNHSLKTLPTLSSPPTSPRPPVHLSSSSSSSSPPSSSSPTAATNLTISHANTAKTVGASSVSSNTTVKENSTRQHRNHQHNRRLHHDDTTYNDDYDDADNDFPANDTDTFDDDHNLTLKPSILTRGDHNFDHHDHLLDDNQHPPFSFGIVTAKEDQFMKKLSQTLETYYSTAFTFPSPSISS